MITRKHTIAIRLNDREYQHLQKQVTHIRLPREVIIRKLILGLEIIPLPCEHHADLLRKLAGACNNINQLVRLENTFDTATQSQIQSLEDEINQIWEYVRDWHLPRDAARLFSIDKQKNVVCAIFALRTALAGFAPVH